MKLEVPYFSQHNDVVKDEWKSRSCSVVCLGMALSYFSPDQSINLDTLIEEGVLIGGHSDLGWRHTSIALLAHNYGIPAYCEEYRSVSVDIENKTFLKSDFENSLELFGIQKCRNELEKGNLIVVSVPRGLTTGGSHHTILLIGFEEENQLLKGFYFHDPDSKDSSKNGQFIAIEDFKGLWRKMAIIIGKNG